MAFGTLQQAAFERYNIGIVAILLSIVVTTLAVFTIFVVRLQSKNGAVSTVASA